MIYGLKSLIKKVPGAGKTIKTSVKKTKKKGMLKSMVQSTKVAPKY